MHLIVLGLNHISASVSLRESVAVSDVDLHRVSEALATVGQVREAAILSTCNRTELYVAAPSAFANDEKMLTSFLCSLHNIPESDILGHLYCYRDAAAIAHLMKVASGLDSMMLGEYQIMAQVKSCYAAAQAARTTDSALNSLFQAALNVGKRVRTETLISRGAFSVGAAAVEFATRIYGDSLHSRPVLLIGAGQTSELTARHLVSHGVSTIYVANRSAERADSLAAQLEGAASVPYADIDKYLVKADIVICSTSSDVPVVTRSALRSAMLLRRNRPLYLVDIAVPRDVEPSAADLDNVFLYNIDDLSEIVKQAQSERNTEVLKAEGIVADAAAEYMLSRRMIDATPLIVSVRERLESHRLDEMARLRTRLPNLDEREMKAIEQSLQSFSNKIAHDAIISIKSSFQQRDESGYARLAAIRSAFGLDEKSDK